MANTLKANYDALKGYEVDGNGNNIFPLLVRAQLIAKLDAESNLLVSLQNKHLFMITVVKLLDIQIQTSR